MVELSRIVLIGTLLVPACGPRFHDGGVDVGFPERGACPFLLEEALEFGESTLGETSRLAVELRFECDVLEGLEITIEPDEGVFSVLGATDVEPFGEVTFDIEYHPAFPGDHQATIGFATTVGSAELAVSGTSHGPRLGVDAELLDFGTLAPGASRGLPLSLTNEGDRPLVVDGLPVSGDTVFELDAHESDNGTLPWQLDPGATAELTVRARGEAPLDAEGTLGIRSSDPVTPVVIVDLRATVE